MSIGADFGQSPMDLYLNHFNLYYFEQYWIILTTFIFFEKSVDFPLASWYYIQVAGRHGGKQKNADVAELADALDSGSSDSNIMWVQVPSSAPGKRLTDQMANLVCKSFSF